MAQIPEITVDEDACETCRALIVALQNAYLALVAGNTRVRVRHNERWIEYDPGKSKALMDLINMIWSQCPDTDGLLNLNPSLRVKRGGPAYGRVV